VKIRGFRIELKEVEAVIRQFDGIKDATVQAFDYPQGGKYIAAYVVSDSPVDIEALNNFILDQKPPYMVPTATMQLDAIPLNQNQKVNRRALPEPVIGAVGEQQESAAPLNLLEEQLQKLVGTIVNTEEFGITTDLRYLGLTSILAIKLATQVFKQYGVQLDAKKLAKGGVTVQTIENEILRAILASPTAPKGASYAIVSPSGDERGALGAVPLSYAQAGVYFDSIKNPASTLYNTPICIAFPTETDSDSLRKAVQKAVDNHPAMYVQFQTNGTGVVQVIGDRETPVDIPELTMSEEEARAYIQDFVQPFKLNKDRLFRFCIVRTPQAAYLYSDLHHLICDGYSYDLFIHELCDLLEGKEIEPELCSYAEFVFEQKAAEDGEAFAESAAFFKERLAGVESSTEVAADLSNPLPKGDNAKVACPIDWDKVTRLAQEQGVNPSAVMLSAVFYTLSRFAATDDVCITTISNGRSNLKVSNTMGMFVNTLALTTKIGTQSVSEFLRESGDTFEQTLAHENYPFSRIASDFGLNADIMFAYQMGVLSDYRVGGKAVKAEEIVLQNTPKFKIAFYVSDFDGEPTLSIEYDNGQYSADMMQNLAQSVCNAACAFAAAADAPLRSISLLNSAQSEVLDSFNQTEVPYDNTQTVVSLFRRQVEQHPDNIAMVYHDLRLTYKQVDEQSESIAQYVQSLGLGSEDVVSILIPRSEWMVVASLGVLKAGCAYQPLDPSYPAERLNFMMQDANAKLLIADEQLRPIVDEYQGKVLLTKDIAALPAAKAPVKADIKPSSLFILLYTSGSTGTPKGCQLEHGNLVAFCHWYHRYYELKPENKVAAYASYGFDACMMDMYSALTCGAAVYIIGEDIRLNLPQLNDYFNQEGITHSFMTTQVGCQFAVNCDNHSLKHLSVGGEKILPLTPPTAYQLHNAYGPTECTIFTTTYQQKEFEQNAPIGKPLDNLQLFIVDKDQNRLPVGAAGELLVSGPQVSRGYLNLPEKTADTYIQWYGCRCYRTGDIVRYLADGNIQFVGRRDGQVKIRGFRIEMKEVEAVIREFPGIKDATVQAFDYETGGKYIAAYIVSDQQVDTKELNKFIASQKPPYMVPAATMQIDAIPLNQNQKVNRKALPAPVIQASDRDYVEPKNDQERLFAKIFGDILTMDKVSATDNFFELGGTSLMVTRVIIEADKANMHIAYGDVFSNPTPRQLAAFVSGATVPDGSPSASGNEITDFDYTAINNLLQKNTMATFQKGERQTLGDVLLTGATGYLGIHVLRELIDSDAKSIYCMVRGKDQQTAESRLKTLLYYYFSSSFKELFGQRLFVIQGDVTSFDDLPGIHIDTVFNCAANVKHFSRGTDIEDVNIGGAMSCVKFCLKTGARLVHVSTTSVGGLSVNGVPAPDVILTEKNLYFGQNLDNQYCYSKFMADRIILDAVALHGLNAKVMRVGNLAARSTDGEFQVNFQSNSYMGRIKVLNMLGCCPYSMYDDPAEFSPINETARAVVVLASTPKDCTVFHPYNNHIQLMGDILTQLGNITGGVRMVDDDEFERVLDEAKNDPTKAKQMSSMLAYQDMAHGQVAYEVGRDNQYTSQVLHRLGFYWSTTSWDYDQQMLQAIAGFGFFE
ncbi:MAG: amino acid adenylation domain-containing protein, partial [Prevotella sp.]|nr:amino acid adenylation domain-containing protein [Prevotella sp.]